VAAHTLGLPWLLALAAIAARPAHAQVAAPRAARDLERGRVLSSGDIATESTDPRALQLVGWVTRRTIRMGQALRAPALAPPQLVRAGETVTVRLVAAGITVAREGTAMMAGAFGDRVRIRFDAHRSLTGVVAGRSTVWIQ
jgi:flagella basal body P-ring formation protein FlgA